MGDRATPVKSRLRGFALCGHPRRPTGRRPCRPGSRGLTVGARPDHPVAQGALRCAMSNGNRGFRVSARRVQALAELYIDGEWLDPRGRGPPRDPLPRRRDARRDRRRGHAGRHRGRDRRGPPGVRRRALAAHLRRASAAPAAARRRPARARHEAEFARAESLDTGKRLVESRVRHRRRGRRASATTAGVGRRRTPAGSSTPATPDAISRIVHEPVGVCGLITPWNYPLLQASWKVAPAPGRPATRSCSSRAS